MRCDLLIQEELFSYQIADRLAKTVDLRVVGILIRMAFSSEAMIVAGGLG